MQTIQNVAQKTGDHKETRLIPNYTNILNELKIVDPSTTFDDDFDDIETDNSLCIEGLEKVSTRTNLYMY